MALRRFRYEVEGTDQEDVEQQLDDAFVYFSQAVHDLDAAAYEIIEFECTDENVKPIQRNGQPLMYGRRVFVVKEKVSNA